MPKRMFVSASQKTAGFNEIEKTGWKEKCERMYNFGHAGASTYLISRRLYREERESLVVD